MIKTTSLELSKKMKELGFPQENSAFNWYGDYSHKLFTLSTKEQIGFWKPKAPAELPIVGIAAAFLAEEVLEQLPGQIFRKVKLYLQAQKKRDYYYVAYWNSPVVFNSRYEEFVEAKTLAEAVGKMWVYLKEQGLLKGKV